MKVHKKNGREEKLAAYALVLGLFSGMILGACFTHLLSPREKICQPSPFEECLQLTEYLNFEDVYHPIAKRKVTRAVQKWECVRPAEFYLDVLDKEGDDLPKRKAERGDR